MYNNNNMINEELENNTNEVPFVTFYDMHAVVLVLPDKMADLSIAGLQRSIPISRLNHTGSQRPSLFHSTTYIED